MRVGCSCGVSLGRRMIPRRRPNSVSICGHYAVRRLRSTVESWSRISSVWGEKYVSVASEQRGYVLHTHFVAVTRRTRKTAPWWSDLSLITLTFFPMNGLRCTSTMTEGMVATVAVPVEASSGIGALSTSGVWTVVVHPGIDVAGAGLL